MNIAERLKHQLQIKHLTVYQLCKEIGINQSLVGKIINGETEKPRMSTMTAIADHLGVPVNWLYYGEGQESLMTEGEIKNYTLNLDSLTERIEQAIKDFNNFQVNASNNMANILTIVNAQKDIIASQQKTIEVLSETIKSNAK